MLGPQHLQLWDEASAMPNWARPAMLACGFGCAPSFAAATAWPVGGRDAALLAVHRAAFGDGLDLVAPCPACGEPAAFTVAISALLAQPVAADGPVRVAHGAGVLACRRPSAADLAAAWAGTQSLDVARSRLVAACVTADGATADAVDEDAARLASAALTQADPLGDIRFALACPACGHAWEVLFDPPRTLWRTLDAWARQLLEDVRRMARFYGWSERDILAMHASRRRFYLDAVT